VLEHARLGILFSGRGLVGVGDIGGDKVAGAAAVGDSEVTRQGVADNWWSSDMDR
jgi:hypothetical protein